MTRRIAAAVIALLLLTGCVSEVDGAAVPEPLKLDCDLIFPPVVTP